MNISQITNVVTMLRRALNMLDYRLIDHGERVAYLIWKLFEHDPSFTKIDRVKMCYLALFHDIGAYKTELLDSLTEAHDESLFSFEMTNTLEHSVYGYLFLRSHAYFKEYACAILFHHFTYPKLLETDCLKKDLAAALFIADRLDIVAMRKRFQKPEEVIQFLKNKVFRQDYVERLELLEAKEGVISKLLEHSYKEEFIHVLNQAQEYDDSTEALVHILPHAIDFRSAYTVTHTVATMEISVKLAELLNLSEYEISNIYFGALLHDIGKIATALMILEKDTKLDDFEFHVIKDHVVLTEHILKDCVSEEILNIAARHHEKLDGSGYPKKLTRKDLTLSERIVAVGDVLSALMGQRSYKEPFPKEKVCAIIEDLSATGKLCPAVVGVALKHYDEVQKRVDFVSNEAMKNYEMMRVEAQNLMAKYEQKI